MLDKIRLNAVGKLPPDYQANIGDDKPGMFDYRCCKFLGLSFADIKAKTLEGGSDESVLGWIEERGAKRSDEECVVWNAFLMKRGWHDHPDNVNRLRQRVRESGLEGKPIETFFDYIDFDEGRDPVAARLWEAV